MGRADVVLFEDSCDTMTKTLESDVSAISFYASHVVTCGGLGGMVMFNDETQQARALMYRDWGRVGNNSEKVEERFADDVDGIEYDFKFLYGVKGYNMKACEMNAAFGLEQMKKLGRFSEARRTNIDRYVRNLRGTSYVLPREDYNTQDWLALPLQHKDRSGVIRYLEENNVQIRVCFAGNITRHPAYRGYLDEKSFPNSDLVMQNGFLLGAHHGCSEDDIDYVCSVLKEFDLKSGNTGGSPVTNGNGTVEHVHGPLRVVDNYTKA